MAQAIQVTEGQLMIQTASETVPMIFGDVASIPIGTPVQLLEYRRLHQIRHKLLRNNGAAEQLDDGQPTRTTMPFGRRIEILRLAYGTCA